MFHTLRQGGRIMGITRCGGSCVTEGGGERVTNTARGILLGGHTCKHLSALGTRGGRRCSCRVLEGSEEGGNESIGVGAVFLPEWESCCWQPGSVCSTRFCLLSKVKQMRQVWLCICSGKQFEDTFENTQWKKSKQIVGNLRLAAWGYFPNQILLPQSTSRKVFIHN